MDKAFLLRFVVYEGYEFVFCESSLSEVSEYLSKQPEEELKWYTLIVGREVNIKDILFKGDL